VPPVASFDFTPASPVVGALVAFDGSASSDPDGSIASWAWSFGDGATGTGATTSHAYGATGDYTAQLTVTDNSGGSASTTRQVPVGPAPVTPPHVESQPAPASPATVLPQLGVRVARQSLGVLLRRGLAFTVSSNLPGTVRAKLSIPKRTAKRLGLRSRLTIASGRRDILAGASLPMRLRPARAVRAHLRTAHRLRATLTITLGATTVAQPVSVAR
jgi:hypothetical protein